MEIALLRCLETYRTTPNPLTGKSPAEILHGRQHRTILSQMVPDRHSSPTLGIAKFEINEAVYARNYSKGHRWIDGTVIAQMGKKMYLVRTHRGDWKRHQNQMKSRSSAPDAYTLSRDLASSVTVPPVLEGNDNKDSPVTKGNRNEDSTQNPHAILHRNTLTEEQNITPRRSQRTRKQVVRFGFGSTGQPN